MTTLTENERLTWGETLALRIVELAADPILSKHHEWNEIVGYADALLAGGAHERDALYTAAAKVQP